MADDFNPKARLSLTAAAGFWLIVAAVACPAPAVVYRVPKAGLSAGLVCLALGLLVGLLGRLDVERSGGRLRGPGRADWAIVCSGVILLLLAVVWPAVSAGSMGRRRAQSFNNLRQIGLAFENYRLVHGRFPPADVLDRDGRPLYSWRVLLLPFLDEQKLYDRFHLDEPWDGPHNRRLLAEMPPYFEMPHRADGGRDQGTTLVQVFRGPGTAFESDRGEPGQLPEGASNFPDGDDRTLLAVEARNAVPWTRPMDLPYHPGAQLPALGGVSELLPGRGEPGPGFLGVFADGTVRDLRRSLVSEKTLRAMISRNGGEPIGDREF